VNDRIKLWAYKTFDKEGGPALPTLIRENQNMSAGAKLGPVTPRKQR
jgi:hypothetical protein